MSLTNLVRMVLRRRECLPEEKTPDWPRRARAVLIEEFGVVPTDAEVEELAAASVAAVMADGEFFAACDEDDGDDEGGSDRQTGGGIRVVRKPEPFS